MDAIKHATLKVFISQPMNGKSDTEIEKDRSRAIDDVTSLAKDVGYDVEIIDSFIKSTPHEANPVWYLGESIKLMSNADVIYFVKGWENTRGCTIEKMIAETYKLGVSIFEK